MRRLWLPIVMLTFCPAGLAKGAESLFRSISPDEALKLAEKDKKWVFIDFYATWCQPCKMLDETTWKDDKVTKWLAERAIALKIDAEKEKGLAEKYKVRGFPTLLFIKSDGSEFERRLGYLTPEEFLDTAEGVDKGKTILQRIEEQLATDADDAMLHYDRAMELAMRERSEEAWKELSWCFEHMTDRLPELAGIRDTRVLFEALSLGGVYEPAITNLRERFEAAEKRIIEGKASSFDYALYAGVGQASAETDRLLATYDKVMKDGPAPVAAALHRAMFEVLLANDRTEDLAKRGDLLADAEAVFRSGRQLHGLIDAGKFGLASRNPATRPALKKAEDDNTASQASGYYQALLALGQAEKAGKVAEQVLKLNNDGETLNMLAWAGYMSGKPIKENLEQAKKALALAGGSDAAIVDTLARLMDKLGQKAEAVKVCEDALAKAKEDRDRRILQECLDEIKGGETDNTHNPPKEKD